MGRKIIRRTALASVAAISICSSAAFGQTNPATPQPADSGTPEPGTPNGGGSLGDIVVTAQKRSESIQRVPISIQALNTETLARHNAGDFAAYANLLPSVTFKTLGPGRNEVFFRGVTTGVAIITPSQLLPTVGVYFDEVPVTTSGRMLDVHVYDLARVEALAGPQGTLYGASSLAGTVRMLPNAPNAQKFEAGYDAQVNKYGKGNFGGQLEAFINVPLSERIAIRGVGFYTKEGGYIDNKPGTIKYTLSDNDPTTNFTKTNASIARDDFNPSETYGGRIALGIDLDDNWTVSPMIMAQHQDSRGSFLYEPRVGDLAVRDYTDGYNKDKWYQAEMKINGKIGDFDLLYAGGYLDRKIDNLNDYTYYTVYYDSVPGYTKFPKPGGGFLDPTQAYLADIKQTKQTHEFRVASPHDWPITFQLGAFYQRQRQTIVGHFFVNGLGASGALIPGTSLPWAVHDDSQFYTDVTATFRDSAIFGEASYHITPTLSVTGGIRGFRVHNTNEGFFGTSFTAKATGCPIPISTSCSNTHQNVKESGETHKANITWQVTPSKMVYATYSTGFRPGGANRRAGVQNYEPDTLSNYEIGFKATWNGNLRINSALYYERWDKIQYALLLPGGNGVLSIFNAGRARVYGIEGDITWAYHGLNLAASGSYNDAALSQDFCRTVSSGGAIVVPKTCAAPDVSAPKGTRLPTQPRFKASLTARYDTNLRDNMDGFIQGVINHQGGTHSVLNVRENALLGNTDGFTSFDASVGVSWTSGIRLELFAVNLFDTRGELSHNTLCAITICSNSSRTYPNKPQFFGLKVGQRF